MNNYCNLQKHICATQVVDFVRNFQNSNSERFMKSGRICVIEKEADWYVALCPELNVASQGKSVSEARENLGEALELFFECASAEEVSRRLTREKCG